MRQGSAVFAAFLVLAGCGGPPGPPEAVRSVETQLYARQGIDSRREFERAIVGHELSGSGVEVTVAPDGKLIGMHRGVPFVGSWEYRRDQFCTSLVSDRVRDAPDRRCFRAAVTGREVILVPIEEPG